MGTQFPKAGISNVVFPSALSTYSSVQSTSLSLSPLLATPSQECRVFSFAGGLSIGKGSTAHVDTFPVIRWVLRRMRDGGWTLSPNGKEPGFCFIRHSETRDLAISSLVPGSCEESHFNESWLPGLTKAYSVIAKGVGELHGERTQSAVLSSQWCEGATAISQIKLLCMTMKGPGEVTFRCVHSEVSNLWTGLSA